MSNGLSLFIAFAALVIGIIILILFFLMRRNLNNSNDSPTGATGPTGITGPTGPAGPVGPPGPSNEGVTAYHFYVSYGASVNITPALPAAYYTVNTNLVVGVLNITLSNPGNLIPGQWFYINVLSDIGSPQNIPNITFSTPAESPNQYVLPNLDSFSLSYNLNTSYNIGVTFFFVVGESLGPNSNMLFYSVMGLAPQF